MSKIFIVFIFYFYILIQINFNKVNACNGIISKNICCDLTCSNCGTCINNVNIDKLCCNTTIINNNICCQDNNNIAPCVINCSTKNNSTIIYNGDGDDNQYDQIVDWLETLAIYQLVLFIAGCCIFLIFLIYICCWFGAHKPPVKYEYIVGKYS